jgi:hypothetical protein
VEDLPSSYHCLLKGETSIRRSQILGWLRRWGREWSSRGNNRNGGLVTDKELFWSSFLMLQDTVAYKEQLGM